MKNYIIEKQNGKAVVREVSGMDYVKAIYMQVKIYHYERHAQHEAARINGEF